MFSLSSFCCLNSFRPRKENRLTADQPFPAKVVGIAHSWVGYELLLEEIGAKKPRYCHTLVSGQIRLEYTLTTKEAPSKLTLKWKMLSTGVPVGEFQYSKGGEKLGEKFGDEDLLRQAVATRKSLDRAVARQPAKGSTSEGKGKEEMKSEKGSR